MSHLSNSTSANAEGFPGGAPDQFSTAALSTARLERVQQGHHQACAAGADRMAERAGAAIDVQPVARNSEVALRRHRDHRERLVDRKSVV